MPYRCRTCRKKSSRKTGTVMEASNLGYQIGAMALYLLLTGLKDVSSMKLCVHRPRPARLGPGRRLPGRRHGPLQRD